MDTSNGPRNHHARLDSSRHANPQPVTLDIGPPQQDMFADHDPEPASQRAIVSALTSEQHPILSELLHAVVTDTDDKHDSRFGAVLPKWLVTLPRPAWLASAGKPATKTWWPGWSSRDAAIRQRDAAREQLPAPEDDAELPILTTQASVPSPWRVTLGPRSAIAASALLLCALAVAAGSLWMNTRLEQRLQALSATVASLQSAGKHEPVVDNSTVDSLREQVQTEMQQLQQRISGLATANRPPAVDTDKQQAEQQQLLARITELERLGTEQRQQQAQTRQLTDTLNTQLAAQAKQIKLAAAAAHKTHSNTIAKASPAVKSTAKSTASPATDGPWVVNLLSVTSRAEARRERKRLSNIGIDAEIRSAAVNGKTWYRLRVTGFASAADARDFGDRVAVQAGLKGTWAARG